MDNSNFKIVIIEDDPTTRVLIKTLIEKENFKTFETSTAAEGLKVIKAVNADMVLLDLMLPDIEGFEVCKTIRQKPEVYGSPLILMLTSKNDTDNIVKGLELGADEYLTKPFEHREFISRLKALSRRRIIPSKIYKYGPINIDTENNSVSFDNKDITLTKKEYELLTFFIMNKGLTLTRDKIMEEVWKMPFYEDNMTINVYVNKLKEKIPYLSDQIISIRGFGYKLQND